MESSIKCELIESDVVILNTSAEQHRDAMALLERLKSSSKKATLIETSRFLIHLDSEQLGLRSEPVFVMIVDDTDVAFSMYLLGGLCARLDPEEIILVTKSPIVANSTTIAGSMEIVQSLTEAEALLPRMLNENRRTRDTADGSGC